MKKYAVAMTMLAVAAFAPAAEAGKPKVLGKAGGITYAKDTETVAGSSGASQVAQAKCPEGTVTLSGGTQITGPPGDSFLSGMSSVDVNEWFIEGWHLAFEEAKVNSYALCTKKADKVVEDTQPVQVPAGPSEANGQAECPDGFATGGGARLIGAANDWSVNSSFPVDDATDADQVPDDGWRTYAYHFPATSASTMLADALCFTAGKTPEYVVKEVESGAPSKSVKVKCTGGDVAMGGGAFVSGAAEDAHLVKSVPYDSKDDGKLPEDGWSVSFANDDVPTMRTIRAIAICR